LADIIEQQQRDEHKALEETARISLERMPGVVAPAASFWEFLNIQCTRNGDGYLQGSRESGRRWKPQKCAVLN
jgi:hypothetical protein